MFLNHLYLLKRLNTNTHFNTTRSLAWCVHSSIYHFYLVNFQPIEMNFLWLWPLFFFILNYRLCLLFGLFKIFNLQSLQIFPMYKIMWNILFEMHVYVHSIHYNIYIKYPGRYDISAIFLVYIICIPLLNNNKYV